MEITNFTITQDGQIIDNIVNKEQAVQTAKIHAKETGKPISILAHLDDGCVREVIFNPDGTNEKIWNIDKGKRLEPIAGQIYINRGGGMFRCIAPAADCALLYNHAGGSSNSTGVFQNIESGWTFTAKGIIQYIDGTIEWDRSIEGRFEEVTG